MISSRMARELRDTKVSKNTPKGHLATAAKVVTISLEYCCLFEYGPSWSF